MTSWKLTLPCTRTEAEAIESDSDALIALDPPPVLLTTETVADDPDSWRLEAFFDGKPDAAAVAAVRSLVPSAAGAKAAPERIEEQDWVTLSQAGLEPVHAGRFYVHTSTNKGRVPPGAKSFVIEASRAFGTGSHQTTAGCLDMLDRLKRQGLVVRNLLDVGTGTGLLAFAAMHLWPRAHATASDIDPASIEVSIENAFANDVPLGGGAGQLTLMVSAGMEHPLIPASGPYDLIVANILAGPLIELAPAICASLAEGGTLVLAGLLDRQQAAVAAAYRRHGLRLVSSAAQGDWPTLRLVKRTRYAHQRPIRPGKSVGNAPGFGSW